MVPKRGDRCFDAFLFFPFFPLHTPSKQINALIAIYSKGSHLQRKKRMGKKKRSAAHLSIFLLLLLDRHAWVDIYEWSLFHSI